LVIQRFAADAVARGADALVLEVSSHALSIGRVAGLGFDSVGFTNLSHDHLDFHGDAEAYFQAKRKLFTTVRQESARYGKAPFGTVCVDDEAGRRLFAESDDVRGVSTRNREDAACWAVREVGQGGLAGMDAELDGSHGVHRVRLPMVGDFNLANAGVAAAMVAATYPHAEREIWAALHDFTGVPGRLEQVVPGVFVDYAHTPAAVARAAQAVRCRSSAPLTIVVGCGGDRDRSKRPVMARMAGAAADHLILTSDNPRNEAPESILDAMSKGLMSPYAREADRGCAIELALGGEGVRLIVGKGHERYQEVSGRRYHFDDREEVRRCARALSAGLMASEAPLYWGWDAVPSEKTWVSERAILEAKARRGGLWVVSAADPAKVGLSARTRLGARSILCADYADCGAHLAPCHRVLVTSLDVPASLCDAPSSDGELDWSERNGESEGALGGSPSTPKMPTLGSK